MASKFTNEEFDRLIAQAKEALDELDDFICFENITTNWILLHGLVRGCIEQLKDIQAEWEY